jgi:elongation factor G
MDIRKKGDNKMKDHNETEETALPILAGVTVPAPVFFCAIEPSSATQQKQLDFALACLQKEDPSLKVGS